MRLSRRSVIRTGAAAARRARRSTALGAAARRPRHRARRAEWRHGLSLFGDLKYPPGFKHFDYVNPNAPKGGVVRLIGVRHLRQFQPGGRRREGHRSPAGIDRHLRHADGGSRSTKCRPSTGCWPRRSAIPPDFSSVTYRLRADAQAGTTASR